MLGGFKCSKNTLIGLNAFYIIIGILLISIGTHWTTSNRVTSLPIIGGVVACGVFLILISAVGIIGASRHHQVLLFFYMVILFLVFLIQFSVACACLSVSTETQENIATQAWGSVTDDVKNDAQNNFQCCGFETVNNTDIGSMSHPSCFHIEGCNKAQNGSICTNEMVCCSEHNLFCSCVTCEKKLTTVMNKAFQVTGGVSLFFSFTEIVGIWMTMRFRNMASSANFPKHSAFL